MIYAVLLAALFLTAGWWILLPKACTVCGGESHIWDETTKQPVCLQCELSEAQGDREFKSVGQSIKNDPIIYLKLNLKSKKATFLMPEGIKRQNLEYHYLITKTQEWDLSDVPSMHLDTMS